MFREMTKERTCDVQSFSATTIVITFMYFPFGLGLMYLKQRVFYMLRFTPILENKITHIHRIAV